ncbi:MAG TPA: hypothetical protein VKE24_06010 [Candidatus Acidoferrales bacterium]|nr:hypothetical protein [Candidatus Acidoferrales bacterium]
MKNESRQVFTSVALLLFVSAMLLCASAVAAQEWVKALDSPVIKESPPHKKSAGKKSARLDPSASAPWAPADVDTVVPAVASHRPCSLPEVLSATSWRVKELVTNLHQFTATEWLEQVDGSANSHRRETRTFTYLAAIEQIRLGMLSVDEYRNGGTSLEEFPARLATTGLAAFALIFHPYYVEDFEMTCEGLGQWRGLPAWQVHFRQRDDRPSRMRGYRMNQLGYPVKLKGRAWIAADTHQVVRLETDLAEEIPAIQAVPGLSTA